jgi:hypothetical protein
VYLDAGSDQVIRLSLTEKIPDVPAADSDTKWVKHVKDHSELLSRFWGRPIELGAVLLLPDGWEEHPTAHYPLIVYQITLTGDWASGSAASQVRVRVTSSIRIGRRGACRGSS